MKTLLKWLLVLLVLGITGVTSYPQLQKYLKKRNHPRFREAVVTRGDLVSVVNSTGTIQPVLSVQIGSVVSGPIEKIYVDYNSQVKTGDLLAKIDPRIYKANVARDQATLAHNKADVERVKALLEQATNDEKRARSLRSTKEDYISDAEIDQFKANRGSLLAQLKVSEAVVKEAEANLGTSEANLGYTIIKSPVNGIVIDRKVDPGQTLASSFQTPTMFILAPDMDKKMYVYASVDEADIGLIRNAQRRKQPVHFTVDAYPEDLFEGRVAQVRMNSATTQNVVTYTVVIETPNPELKLMPGMTANLSFQIEEHRNILKIPNAALRFYPKPEHVRPQDRGLLEGVTLESGPDEQAESSESHRSASETALAARERNRRHVWVVDGDWLRAVEVHTGLSDNNSTELASGPLTLGQKLVTGIQSPGPGGFGSAGK